MLFGYNYIGLFMRRLLLLGCIATTISAGAAIISPEAALGRFNSDKKVKRLVRPLHSPSLVYTQEINSLPAAYVFQRADNEGYLVLSADDEVTPLLGYADEGAFDINNMPEGLRYWLGYYAAEIAFIRQNGITLSSEAVTEDSREPIAPMLSTLWNQGSPFNDKCPEVNETRTVTGCVATAMAQVMKYHNWPAKGTGSNSYTWNNSTLSQDFSSITFGWTDMLDDYSDGATTEQCEAVATLMLACGISVDMNYGTSASGAVARNCVTALFNYFNYDGSMRYLSRDYYGLEDWETEVYNSLAGGCPVLYGGQSEDGGHEFVCDGYSSDSYFHFNWGWGGMSDGYFLLTSLNPDSQGIGGAGSGAGYNFDQDVIVGIKPFAGESSLAPVLYNMSDFTVSSTSVELGGEVSFAAKFYNGGPIAITGFEPGAMFTGTDGNSTFAVNSSRLSLNSGYAYNSPVSYSVVVPSSLTDGEYTVTPIYILNGEMHEISTKVGNVDSVKMTVADGIATFEIDEDAALPRVTEYAFQNTLYAGLAYNVDCTIENSGDVECYQEIYGRLTDASGNVTILSPMQVDLQPGDSATMTYGGTLSSDLASGSYKFDFVTLSSSGSYTSISDTTDVTINAKPAEATLTLDKVSFARGSSMVPRNNLGIEASVTCSSGVYYGTVDMYIFENKAGNSWSSCAMFPSEMLYLNEGDTADLTYNSDFSEGNIGEQYLVAFYYDGKEMPGYNYITLTDDRSGVDGILPEVETVDVELYNLMGQRISGKPSAGHYIMVKSMADGSRQTEHVIIK